MIKSIGKHTYGVHNVQLHWPDSGSFVEIGKFCSIASNTHIYLGGNHRTDWITTYPFGHTKRDVFNSFDGTGHPATKGNVIIGNDVWIGDNVTIMSGINIGDGSVLACNSHIVKDVKPYTITGGNPAQEIKLRFTPQQIESLLRIKWWDWEDQKINENANLLCSKNIQEFIDKHI
jgi:acetyltransferase-like isoleucine patch superfamily enzyme